MSDWERTRQAWARDQKTARRRARAATVALLATAALAGLNGLVAASQVYLLDQVGEDDGVIARLELTDTLYTGGGVARVVVFIATSVLFLRWLSWAVTLAPRLAPGARFRWTSTAAVWGFFIPFVNFIRPYEVVRDLHDHLAPDGVPEPAPRPRLDGSGGYRSVAMDRAPAPETLRHASIGAWWALHVLANVLARFGARGPQETVEQLSRGRAFDAALSAVQLGTALFAVLVVRAIDSRIAERRRRLYHASDAELDALELDRG